MDRKRRRSPSQETAAATARSKRKSGACNLNSNSADSSRSSSSSSSTRGLSRYESDSKLECESSKNGFESSSRKHGGTDDRSSSSTSCRSSNASSGPAVMGQPLAAPPSGAFKVPTPIRPPYMTVKQLREERSKLLTEHFGYSSLSNPFGDRMLAEPFVWKKKNQLLQAAGQKGKTTVAALLQSSKSKVEEIESVKRRREEREAEEQLLQQQREEMQRERERENYEEFAKKEELFHRKTQLQKTAIRLQQQRGQIIDYLVVGLRFLAGKEDNVSTDMLLPCPPQDVFEHYGDEPLTVTVLEQLISDVKLQVETADEYQEFWKSFLLLSKEALIRAQQRKQVLLNLVRDSTPQAAAAAAAQLAATAAAATPGAAAAGSIYGQMQQQQQRERDSGIVLSVAAEVESLLSSKSLSEIQEIEQQVNDKLENEEDIDIAYWEAISEKIPVFKARAVCMQTWRQMLDKAAEMERKAIEEKAAAAAASAEIEKTEKGSEGRDTEDSLEDLLLDEAEAKKLAKIQQIKECAFRMARTVEKHVNPNADGSYSPILEPYTDEEVPPPIKGPYSPVLYPFDEFRDALVISPEEDEQQREALKKQLVQKQYSRLPLVAAAVSPLAAVVPARATTLQSAAALPLRPLADAMNHDGGANTVDNGAAAALAATAAALAVGPKTATAEALLLDPAAKVTTYEEFVRKESKTLTADEEVMSSSAEQRLSLHYTWEEKYRPRKPRFFNRVRTGYSWSKYNSTHYDHDNPPPKVVQGYKFNIFYPDLIDKSKTPTWSLHESDTKDTVIIRFHAGPPYEDVAFKILNQEWLLERTRGYRNVFDRGIMQLYFSFKRYVYRR